MEGKRTASYSHHLKKDIRKKKDLQNDGVTKAKESISDELKKKGGKTMEMGGE